MGAATAVIRLTELSDGKDGSFAVAVEYEDGSRYEVTVSDPASESDEALFGWYFEQHLWFPFLDGDRRRLAVERLGHYGDALFGQVFGGEAGGPYREIRQRGFDGCRIEVMGNEGLHRLHWEALRDPKVADTPLAVRVPIVRRVARWDEGFKLRDQLPTLNILVVTARPDGAKDVGFRTISRPLLDAVRQASLPVRVELVRPGTWTALREHLRATTEDESKGSGWYHLVHFDLHGLFTDRSTIQTGMEKGRYLFTADRDFGEGRQGFLFFESEEDSVADPRSAREVASLLATHRVPMAVLNACQSAMQSTSEAALAHQLVEAGVPLVMGMAYSVTVTAAQLAMPELYRRLTQQADTDRAMLGARQRLFDDPARDGYFDQQVPLQDWLLPVVFQQKPVALRLREMTDEETDRFHTHAEEVGDEPATKGEYGFVGRDLDIQAIERLLLLEDRPNQLLVRGMAGAGKSTLLTHLGWWWRRTGLVEEIFAFSYENRAWTVDQIVRGIAARLWQGVDLARWEALSETAKRERVASVLRATRYLLVLDNTESITASPAAIPHALAEEERTALRRWLARLRGGRTLVLWGSREPETWAAADSFGTNVYELGGLDRQAATTLADRILTHHHATHHRDNPDEQRALTELLTLLGGYPLPLEVVLPRLATTPPSEVVADLNTGATDADPVGLIQTAIEYSHGKLDPTLQHSLLMLAPFTASIPGGQILADYQELLTEHQPTQDEWGPVDVAAGLAAATEIGLAADHPVLAEWAQIMPVLPYFLRQRLQHHPTWQVAAQHAHYQLHAQLGAGLQSMMVSREPQLRQTGRTVTHASFANLAGALDYALQHQQPLLPILRALEEYLDQTRQQAARWHLLQTAITALEQRSDSEAQRELMYVTHLAGMVAQVQRRFTEAEQLYRQALDLKLEYNDRRGAASTYHQLGIVAQEQRRFTEADQLYRQALDLKLEFNDRRRTASTYHQLGRVAEEQRRFTEADQLYRQALDLKLEFNDRHSAATTYHQLGIVAQEQRRFTEADQLYRQALDLKLEFNDRHSAASTYHQLGIVAEEQRRFTEADQLYRQALDLALEFNDRHGAASTYHQLGRVAEEQRRFTEADQLYRQALDLELEFNDRHGAALTYHQLGTVALEQRRFTEADQLYRQALDLRMEFNDRHGAALTYHQLGRVALEQRCFTEADQLYRQALDLKLEFNDRHGAASTYHQLGRVAQDQQRFTEADQFYRQAEKNYRDESDERGVSAVGSSRGRLLAEQERYSEAFEVLIGAAVSWHVITSNFDPTDLQLLRTVMKKLESATIERKLATLDQPIADNLPSQLDQSQGD